MNSFNLICLHVCVSYQHLPPIDLPVLIPCQPILPVLSPGDIGVFGVCFRGMNFALLYSIHHGAPPSCTKHATPTSCVSDHSHLLVVAPPSLPCSPPPSCLDPSLLSQASPLRRDTPRSHDDGGMHSRGRSRLFKPTSLGGCRVRRTWTQVSADRPEPSGRKFVTSFTLGSVLFFSV